jgi:hypothetical protein
MSKLLKKLKPGVRVIDIESSVEGYVSYNRDIVPNNITVEFDPSILSTHLSMLGLDDSIRAISYPISDIENRIKLANKFGDYKLGDRVKDISNFYHYDREEDKIHTYKKQIGGIIEINDGVVFVDFCDYVISYTITGRRICEGYLTEPVLKRCKVKQ